MVHGRENPRLTLALIGTAAGAFSGLFGVGGGTVIVPLLIVLFAYTPRLATGTSLAAIVGVAALAALAQGAYGNVHALTALVLALPATVGVLVGTTVQQRLPQQAISYVFAALLILVAIEMILP